MESLALVVTLMLLAEVLAGLAVIVFAAIYRRTGKFKITSLVLLGLLALWTIWAAMQLVAFAMPALFALVLAALLRFLPRFKR